MVAVVAGRVNDDVAFRDANLVGEQMICRSKGMQNSQFFVIRSREHISTAHERINVSDALIDQEPKIYADLFHYLTVTCPFISIGSSQSRKAVDCGNRPRGQSCDSAILKRNSGTSLLAEC